MKSTTRLQIELPKASMDRLRALKEKTEAVSYAEVVRDAFKLYERMIEYAEAGSAILIRDKGGNVREIEIFY
jgi:Ribbon-helix-helix protein, copG family